MNQKTIKALKDITIKIMILGGLHQVPVAPVSPPISKPTGFPGATRPGSEFLSTMPPTGLMMGGLFPPAAMAAAAARQFVAQQQTAQPPAVPVSSAGLLSAPRNLTTNPVNSNGNRVAPRTSPTKIPRVGQGQVTCNCGIVFPSLEILERHAKEVHPENTNLVSITFQLFF